jgi:hypothetical protein
MAVFFVFIREKTRDQSEMDAYTPKTRASFEGRPVTIHALYGHQEVLEGPENEGVVIISVPSAVVTGASKGNGASIAKHLADEGGDGSCQLRLQQARG